MTDTTVVTVELCFDEWSKIHDEKIEDADSVTYAVQALEEQLLNEYAKAGERLKVILEPPTKEQADRFVAWCNEIRADFEEEEGLDGPDDGEDFWTQRDRDAAYFYQVSDDGHWWVMETDERQLSRWEVRCMLSKEAEERRRQCNPALYGCQDTSEIDERLKECRRQQQQLQRELSDPYLQDRWVEQSQLNDLEREIHYLEEQRNG